MWAQVHYWLEMGTHDACGEAPDRQGARLVRLTGLEARGLRRRDRRPIENRTKYDRPVSRSARDRTSSSQYVARRRGDVRAPHVAPRHSARPSSSSQSPPCSARSSPIGALLEGRPWARSGGARPPRARRPRARDPAVSRAACRRDRRPSPSRRSRARAPSCPRARRSPRAPWRPSTRTSMRHHRRRRAGSDDTCSSSRRASTPSKRYPLILVFHGDGGHAARLPRGLSRSSEPPVPTRSSPTPKASATRGTSRRKVDNRDVKFAETIIDELSAALPGRLVHASSRPATRAAASSRTSSPVSGPGSSARSHRTPAALPTSRPRRGRTATPSAPGRRPSRCSPSTVRTTTASRSSSGRFSAEYWAYVNGCKTDEMETTGYHECHVVPRVSERQGGRLLPDPGPRSLGVGPAPPWRRGRSSARSDAGWRCAAGASSRPSRPCGSRAGPSGARTPCRCCRAR